MIRRGNPIRRLSNIMFLIGPTSAAPQRARVRTRHGAHISYIAVTSRHTPRGLVRAAAVMHVSNLDAQRRS
eukprot:5054399-Pleurochrysis_carterae.AAC.1